MPDKSHYCTAQHTSEMSGCKRDYVKAALGLIPEVYAEQNQQHNRSYRFCEGAILLQELYHTVGQLRKTHSVTLLQYTRLRLQRPAYVRLVK